MSIVLACETGKVIYNFTYYHHMLVIKFMMQSVFVLIPFKKKVNEYCRTAVNTCMLFMQVKQKWNLVCYSPAVSLSYYLLMTECTLCTSAKNSI